MEFGIASYGLGYIAGVLSILSPCVLPLVPIVLGTASSTHRFGPVALTAGLSLSFTAIGLFIAVAGAALGIDETAFRSIAATLLVLIGGILMSSGLQARLALATSAIGNWGQLQLTRLTLSGVRGQFVVGTVLGAVWSPCVGPTLGAAAVVAAQGRDLVQASIVMATFGAGAGTSMIVLGFLSRSLMVRIRGKLMSAGKAGKTSFGGLLVLTGASVLIGFDKMLEAALVGVVPEWLLGLTTRY